MSTTITTAILVEDTIKATNINDTLDKTDKRVIKEPIILVSKDKKSFTVEKSVILKSGLINDMLEEDEESDDVPSIPLVNVESKTLEKIIEYLDHYSDKSEEILEKPLKGNIEDIVSDFAKKYLESLVCDIKVTEESKVTDESKVTVDSKDRYLLIQVIMAANYLNIKSLLDLTCAKVASDIKGKSSEEIRQMFGIEDDFTDEEREKIKKENVWINQE